MSNSVNLSKVMGVIIPLEGGESRVFFLPLEEEIENYDDIKRYIEGSQLKQKISAESITELEDAGLGWSKAVAWVCKRRKIQLNPKTNENETVFNLTFFGIDEQIVYSERYNKIYPIGSLYLDTPELIADFEFNAGMKLDDIPLWVNEDSRSVAPLPNYTNADEITFPFVRTEKRFDVFKVNPKLNEKQNSPARLSFIYYAGGKAVPPEKIIGSKFELHGHTKKKKTSPSAQPPKEEPVDWVEVTNGRVNVQFVKRSSESTDYQRVFYNMSTKQFINIDNDLKDTDKYQLEPGDYAKIINMKPTQVIKLRQVYSIRLKNGDVQSLKASTSD